MPLPANVMVSPTFQVTSGVGESMTAVGGLVEGDGFTGVHATTASASTARAAATPLARTQHLTRAPRGRGDDTERVRSPPLRRCGNRWCRGSATELDA